MFDESVYSMLDYWGDLPPVEEIPEDFAELFIQNTMKPVPVKLHETCDADQEPNIEVLPPECSAMEPTVVHTIKLLQYSKAMESIIEQIKSKGNSVNVEDLTVPEFPEAEPRKLIHPIVPYRFSKRVSTPFMEGDGAPPHRLSEYNARSILKKCVAAIFAHLGFDDAPRVALDIMTDISEQYLTKFTRLLHVAADKDLLSGNVGFPDIMEQTFHEMGIGSILELHRFYQERILLYHERVLVHCRKLAEEYVSITTSSAKEQTQDVIETKMETEEDYSNVPELHVPASSDGMSPDQLCPPFVQGFKMLQKFEQEEELQSIIKEEDITISETPK